LLQFRYCLALTLDTDYDASSPTFHKTSVLHNNLKKDTMNEFRIKHWTSSPVWVKFQEHGISFYLHIEEKVSLLAFMYISSKFKCQLSFNWHLILIKGCASQSCVHQTRWSRWLFHPGYIEIVIFPPKGVVLVALSVFFFANNDTFSSI
jgi:cytochrome c oxidase subunit IV